MDNEGERAGGEFEARSVALDKRNRRIGGKVRRAFGEGRRVACK